MFLIVVIFKFVDCNVWIVDLWFGLGFLIVILIVFKLCFIVDLDVVLEVICVVNGVDFLDFLNFNVLVDDYDKVLLNLLVIVIIVLLNVEWMCVILFLIFFFILCLWDICLCVI